MTFLKKLGSILAQGIALATGIWPLVSPLFGSKAQGTVPTVINDLTQIGGVVVQAETLLQGTGTGPDKLAAATPLVANIVKTSELISGHQIGNDSLFIQGCGKITSGVADVLNSLKVDNLKTSGTPVTVPVTPVPPVVIVPPAKS